MRPLTDCPRRSASNQIHDGKNTRYGPGAVIKSIAVAVGGVALMLIVIGLFVFLTLSNPGVF